MAVRTLHFLAMNSESRPAIRIKYRIAALAEAAEYALNLQFPVFSRPLLEAGRCAAVAGMKRRPAANAKPSREGRRSKPGNPEAERSCIKNPELPPGLH